MLCAVVFLFNKMSIGEDSNKVGRQIELFGLINLAKGKFFNVAMILLCG